MEALLPNSNLTLMERKWSGDSVGTQAVVENVILSNQIMHLFLR